MWRTTGDVKWRENGYAIFQAINKFARTEYGFTSVQGVDGNITPLDDMPFSDNI
jgi:mannosyl-oligosaccharide alpha-1,2-mannosidase